MYHVEGLTLAEMGEAFGISRQAVRQRMIKHGVARDKTRANGYKPS